MHAPPPLARSCAGESIWNIYTGSSEGCLYLNIYAPTSAPPPGGFPVMFFVHGGSWEFGSGSFLLYDADSDVGLVENTLFVTINYRLNIFGFLAGDALKAESPDGSVGNYGFQDQRAALQVVIDIIGDFGGNPNLITFFGESAGGGSTSSHLVSPRSAGMFQRAIIESGAWASWTAQPYNISATRLPQLAGNVNCGSAPDVLACMRALDANTVFNGQNGLTSAFLTVRHRLAGGLRAASTVGRGAGGGGVRTAGLCVNAGLRATA
jgi:para-nitrobenzyl esterase